jgi:hypothetical protein
MQSACRRLDTRRIRATGWAARGYANLSPIGQNVGGVEFLDTNVSRFDTRSGASLNFVDDSSGNERRDLVGYLQIANLKADDFQKNTLAVLADIAENHRYRNVPQHDDPLLRIMAESINPEEEMIIGISEVSLAYASGYDILRFRIKMPRALRSTLPHVSC